MDEYFKFCRIFSHQSGWEEEEAYNCQKKVLQAILQNAEDSTYSQLMKLNRNTSVDEFRAMHPMTEYDYYIPWIEKQISGKNALIPNPCQFVVSSGTGGKAKKCIVNSLLGQLPKEEALHQIEEELLITKIDSPKTLLYLHFPQEKVFRDACRGVPISFFFLKHCLQLEKWPFASPKTLYTMEDPKQGALLNLAICLLSAESITTIYCPLIVTLLQLISALQNHSQALCSLIEHGFAVGEHTFKGQPERACVIQNELQSPCIKLKKLWPNLSYIRTAYGGSLGFCINSILQYCEGIHLYSPSVIASEGFLGLNFWPKAEIPRYTFLPFSIFYEFLEVGGSPNVPKLINELKLGICYELVITTFSGLYRYKIGDIIKIVDFYHSHPIFEVVGRSGVALNALGEKISSYQVQLLINQLSKEFNFATENFTFTEGVQDEAIEYSLFIEIAAGIIDLELMKRKLDQLLSNLSETYKIARETLIMKEPAVFILKKGSFTQLSQLVHGKGVVNYKPPSLTKKKDEIEFLHKCVAAL